MSREETFVDELPEMVICINEDCGAMMHLQGGMYRCPRDGDTITVEAHRRRQEEAKQVVAV